MSLFHNGNAIPTELLAIVQRMACFAEIYWHPDCFPKAFGQAESDWLSALIQFISEYSFEREGAPAGYRSFAREALHNAGDGLSKPSGEFSGAVWQRFQELVKQSRRIRGTNDKNNPLSCELNGSLVAATAFVMKLEEYGFNILKWSLSQLRAGKAEQAANELDKIRGVGLYKIATFYLRDVARHFQLDEDACGPGWCFQPVDIWVRRVAAAWSTIWGDKVSEKDTTANNRRAAELFSQLAHAARVRGGDLNVGVWVFGSHLFDRRRRIIGEAVKTIEGLEDCLKAFIASFEDRHEKYIRMQRAIAKQGAIAGVIRSLPVDPALGLGLGVFEAAR